MSIKKMMKVERLKRTGHGPQGQILYIFYWGVLAHGAICTERKHLENVQWTKELMNDKCDFFFLWNEHLQALKGIE